MKTNIKIYLFTAIVSLGGILFGHSIGVIAGTTGFIQQQFSLSPFLTGLVASIFTLGAFVGAISSSKLVDRYGSKAILLITAIIFLIGNSFSSLANNYYSLILNRFFVGVSIGIYSYVVSLYIAEIAPPKIRGRLKVFIGLTVTSGILITYFINLYFARTGNWHAMFAVSIIPALMMVIGVLFLPRSPRWLVHHGYIDEARRVLESIRPKEVATQELQDIVAIVSLHGQTKTISLIKVLLNKLYLPVLLVGIGLAIIQQLSGINAIMYYAPIIFKQAGFQTINSQMWVTVIIGTANFTGNIAGLFLIDRFGRRRLLLTGLAVMSLCLFAFSIAFIYQLKIIAVISILIFIIFYSVSIAGIFWIMIAEIYPLKIRSTAMSIAASCNWLGNLIVALTFFNLLQFLGASAVFIIYAICCALGFIFCYKLVPETKHVSLEKIEQNLLAGKSSRELGQ